MTDGEAPPEALEAPVPQTPSVAAKTDPLAVSSLIFGVGSLVCGALTGVPAVILGWVARRRLEPAVGETEPRPGSGLALAGIVTGLFGSLVTSTALVLLLLHGRPRPTPAASGAGPAFPGPALPEHHPPLPRGEQDEQDEPDEQGEQDEPDEAFRNLFRPDRGAARPGATAFGPVTFVPVEAGERRELAEILASEAKVAAGDHARLLVVGGGTGCGPCASFEAALADELLQNALGKTRIVSFDTADRRRSAELLQAGFDVTKIPAFFLLDGAQKPSRRVDGGAWGDDTAANIAPVLRAFLAGKTGSAVTEKPIVPRPRRPVDALFEDDNGPHL